MVVNMKHQERDIIKKLASISNVSFHTLDIEAFIKDNPERGELIERDIHFISTIINNNSDISYDHIYNIMNFYLLTTEWLEKLDHLRYILRYIQASERNDKIIKILD